MRNGKKKKLKSNTEIITQLYIFVMNGLNCGVSKFVQCDCLGEGEVERDCCYGCCCRLTG